MARLLQLSDLHVVTSGAMCSEVLDTRTILKTAIDRLLERSAALAPLDAVLVTGDVSHDGTTDSYAFARAELERLGLPLLVVPGNHDTREAFRAGFADLPFMPPSGLIDWTVEIGDTLIVGLDTLVEGQGGGKLRPESLGFLTEALKKAGTRPVVVALHHPPLRSGIQFMDDIGLQNRSALKAALHLFEGDVTFVAGHVHGVYHGRLGQHSVVTAPAICSHFALDRRANAAIGFMSGPTGCAVIDTAPEGVWSAIPLDTATGPFSF